MDINNCAIATITWARDSQEEALLRKSLEQLAKFRIPVFVTDGGSGPLFLNFLNSFSNFTVCKTGIKGLWPQAQYSVIEAYESGAEFVFYTEPDKYDFFSRFMQKMFNKIMTGSDTGIIMASRSMAAFNTYPAFQRMTESTINMCCAEIFGKAFDYTYGPFLMNSNIVPFLRPAPNDIGWGWRQVAFGVAHRLDYKIEAFVEDFYCPVDQQVDTAEERIYRMRQLSQNIEGLVLSRTLALLEEPEVMQIH